MLKFLALLCIVSAVKSEVSIEWFNGRWVAALEIPRESWFPLCMRIDFEAIPDRHCTCGNETLSGVAVNILHKQYGNATHRFPAKIVDTPAEVKDALALECECDTDIENKISVYRKINENYFVLYAKHHRPQEEYKAYLMLKKAPKLSEFRKVLKNIVDLSQKEPGYMCEPNFFVNEFDDLD